MSSSAVPGCGSLSSVISIQDLTFLNVKYFQKSLMGSSFLCHSSLHFID